MSAILKEKIENSFSEQTTNTVGESLVYWVCLAPLTKPTHYCQPPTTRHAHTHTHSMHQQWWPYRCMTFGGEEACAVSGHTDTVAAVSHAHNSPLCLKCVSVCVLCVYLHFISITWLAQTPLCPEKAPAPSFPPRDDSPCPPLGPWDPAFPATANSFNQRLIPQAGQAD